MAEQIDTIVRFHDSTRLRELSRCIFSLAGQSYRPLRIILVLQRFSESELGAVHAAIRPLLEGDEQLHMSIVNWQEAAPLDARSVLLNAGVKEANGRYLGFLDYDDVLYPEAYELLVSQIRKTNSAIAFASVRVLQIRIYDKFLYAEKMVHPFSGSRLIDLFKNNFCPIHSYLIDRHQVTADCLIFNPYLTLEEDYDVLLRVCAKYPSDFSLIGTEIGDYYYKSDGSNTVPHSLNPLSTEVRKRHQFAITTIEQRRRMTMMAPQVQRRLGLPSQAVLSIRDVLDRIAV